MNMIHKLGCSLFALAALTCTAPAQAGFEVTFGGSTDNSSLPVPMTAAEDNTTVTPDQDYNLAKGIDEQAPALKVFNERYVPDSIRQKYSLPENGAAQPSQALSSMPQPLTVETMESSSSQDQTALVVTNPKHEARAKVVESWRARKGENVRDVLRRWSERESIDLMWASPDAPNLSTEFSYVGSFQDAVNLLLKQNGLNELHSQFRSEGLSPVMMEPASTVTTNLPVPQQTSATSPAPTTNALSSIFKPDRNKSGSPETRWFALSGAPLAEVLNVWAEDAGASVVWQSEKNYALLESVSQVGTFEEAVFHALSQYNDQQIRPVGEMYTDEQGHKILVIKTDASSQL
ncbi:MAG: hypothetical protein AUJ12_04945 [Alphaproteobacteria bacterium CG1_02_46_17]|nr:MAG: hypothetical protein AUJ12_04945 [Alphaproteobacteria bacterium CG1_02_46_17]